jgi:hypothetical protein
VRCFPQEQDFIERFFTGVVGQPPPSSPEDPTRIVKTLFPEEMKQVRDAILLRAVRDSLARWLERIDLPRDLKREMRELHEQL